MTFNIMKITYSDRGAKQFILLTDGLSEILTYDNSIEALAMMQLLNENSDARTEYELRTIQNIQSESNRKWEDLATSQHMDESDIAYNEGIIYNQDEGCSDSDCLLCSDDPTETWDWNLLNNEDPYSEDNTEVSEDEIAAALDLPEYEAKMYAKIEQRLRDAEAKYNQREAKKNANKNTTDQCGTNACDDTAWDRSEYYGTNGIKANEDASIQRMIDLLNRGMGSQCTMNDEDPND